LLGTTLNIAPILTGLDFENWIEKEALSLKRNYSKRKFPSFFLKGALLETSNSRPTLKHILIGSIANKPVIKEHFALSHYH